MRENGIRLKTEQYRVACKSDCNCVKSALLTLLTHTKKLFIRASEVVFL